jgi:hypothetical protein
MGANPPVLLISTIIDAFPAETAVRTEEDHEQSWIDLSSVVIS